jgi:hypothetical protein
MSNGNAGPLEIDEWSSFRRVLGLFERATPEATRYLPALSAPDQSNPSGCSQPF